MNIKGVIYTETAYTPESQSCFCNLVILRGFRLHNTVRVSNIQVIEVYSLFSEKLHIH